jgi:hypothetical protein
MSTRKLRRELSHVTSPNQINELLAMLADRTDRDSNQMRSILISNLHQRY